MTKNKQEPLIIIVGRTASGKDTFANKVITKERTMAISHTTRAKRNGEGDTHIFIDDVNIDDYDNKVLETIVNGHSYFLTTDDLKNHGILVVDAKGVHDLMRLETFDRPFRIFYIDVDRKEREKRYMSRGGASFADFTKRDFAEDIQFMRFEEFISFSELRDEYNVTILRSNKDIKRAINQLNGRM